MNILERATSLRASFQNNAEAPEGRDSTDKRLSMVFGRQWFHPQENQDKTVRTANSEQRLSVLLRKQDQEEADQKRSAFLSTIKFPSLKNLDLKTRFSFQEGSIGASKNPTSEELQRRPSAMATFLNDRVTTFRNNMDTLRDERDARVTTFRNNMDAIRDVNGRASLFRQNIDIIADNGVSTFIHNMDTLADVLRNGSNKQLQLEEEKQEREIELVRSSSSSSSSSTTTTPPTTKEEKKKKSADHESTDKDEQDDDEKEEEKKEDRDII